MGYIIFSVIIILDIIGVYYIGKAICYHALYKKLKVGNNIKCYIVIDDCENNLEMFFKKLLYIYLDDNLFEKINIVTKKQSKNSGYILEKVHQEYPYINLINNAEIKIKKLDE